MQKNNFDLYIFDVDGTLAERDSGDLLPNVARWFAGNDKPVALATNQGGVGLRYWMESVGFGDPSKLPTEQQVYDKLHKICRELNLSYTVIDVCFAYQSKSSGKWSPAPPDAQDDSRWKKEWRKPSPRMLTDAIDYHAQRDGAKSVVMIGDREEDRLAAESAGILFIHADVFFGREG